MRPVGLADTSQPDHVIGAGTPASCTEAELGAAVAAGGTIVFDCGPAPVTIPITSTKTVAQDTVIDGGGRVTLDGGGTVRLLAVASSFELATPLLVVQRLRLVAGSSAAVAGSDVERGGGAIWMRGGTLHLVDSELTDHRAPASGQDVAGGAVYVAGNGAVLIAGSRFERNEASNGGALGLLFPNASIADTVFADNAATGMGGNPGNGGNGGAIYVDGASHDVELCGVTIEENRANAFGGGLFRVANDGVGAMRLDRTSVLGNAIPDGATSLGGGLYLQGVQIELRDSTVARNEARGAGGVFVGPGGTTLAATNVTVAENVALSSLAGGMAIAGGVTGSIRNATFARNEAPGPVAFAAATTGGEGVVLANTIVDGHVVGNGFNPISCLATFLEGGGNLQWPVDRAGGGSDVPNDLCSAAIDVADARLGALAANGGPTPTILPASDSPALEPRSGCPTTDQRGFPRDPNACTAGAVERLPEPGACVPGAATLAGLAARRRRRQRDARCA